MPLMRNPFRRAPGDVYHDEHARQASNGAQDPQKMDITGTRPLTIRSGSTDSKAPAEYQLSEINDSGVFVPPSPPESKRNFWQSRSNASTASSYSHRSVFNENEPFNISRESFDSYRRSFDVSARSPIIEARPSLSGRPSLSTRLTPPLREDHFNPPESQPEERFEDVGLTDEAAKPAKKRSIFARFGDSDQPASENRPGSSGPGSSHSFFGRKRGQSGQGAELGSMPSAAAVSGHKRTGSNVTEIRQETS